ncbi:MAG: Phosphate-import ATP-binding protein PhnC [Alphaproteobacteria bacterium MarineAlpha4_Bin2]|nr:MAG: Phosphate-import ATP-binding protein PhnC [Alphaproteobacteria bacterium MarineAlpha4_Bin2]
MIKLVSVEVIYGNGNVGLKPTSLVFEPREFTVLLGPSGAGKSSLLRTLNHLVEPTGGTVAVNGFGVLSDHPDLRKHRLRTAMIFQQHQLIGRYTCLQNVLVGRLGHHSTLRSLFPFPEKDRRLALNCLDRVGLLSRALQRVDNLSGGQQQRVGIARALAQLPGLILADEPVSSLDPQTAYHVLGVLYKITKQDAIPTILSLHQVELAKKFADRIIGLNNGEVVFDGPPEKLDQVGLDFIYSRKNML